MQLWHRASPQKFGLTAALAPLTGNQNGGKTDGRKDIPARYPYTTQALPIWHVIIVVSISEENPSPLLQLSCFRLTVMVASQSPSTNGMTLECS